MGEGTDRRQTGCAQAALAAACILWAGAVPVGVMFLTEQLLAGTATAGLLAAAAIGVTSVLLGLPFAGLALLTRRRPGWQGSAALATGLVVMAGQVALDAAVRAVASGGSTPALHGEDTWASALRLGALVLYALLAARFAPGLAGVPRRPLRAWLGLSRFDWPALLLALAVAALVTVPWPLTGALGDSLTSLSLGLRALAWALPQVLIFWGVVYRLLTSTFLRPWLAALATILIYEVSTVGGVLPTANWGALGDGTVALPLALLLTALRARECGIYPLLPVAWCTRAGPLLFVDPRDVLATGIPELQHVLSHNVVFVVTAVLGLALWAERRMRWRLHRARSPARARLVAALLAAVALWGAWGVVYAVLGNPGFADDGFLIILEEQADLSAAYTIAGREPRLRYVYDTLVETAERTQPSLRAELDALDVPYRPYYIINMIRVDGHRWLMGRFERRPGVARVLLNPNVREYPRRIPFPYAGDESIQHSVGEIQPNLAAIHADEAWALGVTGEGIVVAGQDTGYDWTHPALRSHYRGWDGQRADHDYDWHDAWDHSAVPFDSDSHGTHTMGTVLGNDGAGNRTGVAPGAQWIGCRNMRRGFGNPGAYAECTEFFLAPYPHGGDPFADGQVNLAPHLVNNSWGCPDFEGCLPGTLRGAVEALRAAGIMMVVGVGNDGPACGTAIVPPANYEAAFSVGATNNTGQIVGFSSRGPADGAVKPDVVAPGESVRSSLPGGDYGYAGGTSMAGPHVAGLVALLWSADSALIGDVDATERLICQAARPRPVENVCTAADEVPKGTLSALVSTSVCACGGVTGVPNNVYGCGFVDAAAAVRAALAR